MSTSLLPLRFDATPRSLPPASSEPSALVALAGSNAGATSNYSPADVNAAFTKIRSTFFKPHTVWKNELTELSATFNSLSPTERRSLVNLLSRAPNAENRSLLSCWIGRVTTRGIAAFDGLDAKGRTRFWEQLVVGQDKQNLVRIFSSIEKNVNPSMREREHHSMEFARVLGVSGSAQQKLGFAGELNQRAVAGSTDAATNSDGRAVAWVLSRTTDPKLLSACVKVLGRAGMDSVVQASLPTRDAADSTAIAQAYEPIDTRLYESLAAVMSHSRNAREKSAFVAASGRVIDALNTNVVGPNLRRKELAAVSRAISTVIGTDPTGIIENVMLQNTVQGRSGGPAALKSYAQALLDSGKGAADIGAITLQLQRGNDLQQDPMAYLSKPESRSGEKPTFVRARVMGGWLGLVGSAVQSRIAKRDSNAAYSSLVFTSSIDALKELVGARFPGFKVAVGLLAPALKAAVNSGLLSWRNEATKSDRSFAQGLVEGAMPRYRNGVEATADWTQTLKTEQSRRLGGS